MGAFLWLIAAQLFSLLLAHPLGLEGEQIRSHGPRRDRLIAVNSIAEERRTDGTQMNNWLKEESFTAAADVQRATMELSMSFSLSMSMDVSEAMIPTSPVAPSDTPIVDTQSPAGTIPSGPTGPTMPSAPSESPIGTPPSGVPVPSNLLPPFVLPPSGGPGPSGGAGPSGPPPPFGLPSAGTPSSPTTPLDTPTALVPSSPSSSPVETSPSSPIEGPVASEPTISLIPAGESLCLTSNNLVAAADESSTPVFLDFSYSAESNTSSIEEFEAELVEEYIQTAVFAIFGCFPDTSGKIAPNTVEITEASCEPTVDGDNNECFVMQTTFIIGVEGEVDTDVAAYEVYKAIQENMENGFYVDAVPEVFFLEFLSPLPLIPPPGQTDDNTPDAIEGTTPDGNVNVSPWAIGFSVASVMGGFVSLLVWARSRRSRNNLSMDETTPTIV